MATRLYLRSSTTSWYRGGASYERTPTSQKDLLRTAGAVAATFQTTTAFGHLPSATKIQISQTTAQHSNKQIFRSERVAAPFTLAGDVTFSVWALENSLGVNAGLRAELSKVTHGGSDIETVIGSVDMTVELPTVSAAQALTITPSVPVVIAENERLILRLFVIPVGGSLSGSGRVDVTVNAASGSGMSYMDLTETVTFKDNGTKLYLRRTNTIGIGTFFDALPTRGSSAFTTGVVSTAAVLEKQWTRTSGGTVLEWVSQRLAESAYFGNPIASIPALSGMYWSLESNIAADVYTRLKVYRLRAGVEALLTQISPASELTTTAALRTFTTILTATVLNPMDLQPDDRIVIRAFIRGATDSTNMVAGHTATINYDHDTDNVNGYAYVSFFEGFALKAEGDAATSVSVPDGLPMSGVGN